MRQYKEIVEDLKKEGAAGRSDEPPVSSVFLNKKPPNGGFLELLAGLEPATC